MSPASRFHSVGVHPVRFVMGSPVSEIGRSDNENAARSDVSQRFLGFGNGSNTRNVDEHFQPEPQLVL